jgi:hypothetical protein
MSRRGYPYNKNPASQRGLKIPSLTEEYQEEGSLRFFNHLTIFFSSCAVIKLTVAPIPAMITVFITSPLSIFASSMVSVPPMVVVLVCVASFITIALTEAGSLVLIHFQSS